MINAWAEKWGVSAEALADMRRMIQDTGAVPAQKTSEGAASQRMRLAASRKGTRLYRNNVGACETVDGRQLRYGLCNESSKVNRRLKSSDYIGITPVTITPRHVGQLLGVFTSVEMKRPGWRYTGTDREVAQLAWLELVWTLGGIAKFSTGEI